MQPVEKIQYKGYTIKVYQDDDPMNPRIDFDNFGHMVCSHGRYNLGDIQIGRYQHNKECFPDVEYAKEFVKRKDIISLPLYLYDHSGLTMQTYPFSCPWDSGQVGFIYVTKEEIRKEYSCKLVTKKIREKAIALLKSEVEIYDQYLTGNVWGYRIFDSQGEERDSCWGYYGNYNKYMIPDCKQLIDHHVKEDEQERAQATIEETEERAA